jgi:hypothetical protein
MSMFKPSLRNLREEPLEVHHLPGLPQRTSIEPSPREDSDNSSKQSSHSYENFAAESDTFNTTNRARNLKNGNFTRRRSLVPSQGSVIEESAQSSSPRTSASGDGVAVSQERLIELWKSYEETQGLNVVEDENAIDELVNLAITCVS